MISSVFVSGRLAESPFPGYRYIEVERPVPDSKGQFKTDRFLVRDALAGHSMVSILPVGAQVVFKGRIEIDDKYGFVIVEELVETITRGERKEE